MRRPQVLADVLDSRRGALYGLVPEGKALFTNFSFDPLRKAGLAYAVVGFPAGGDGQAAEREIRSVLGRIARGGVAADLVAAAKLHERRAAAFEKTSISGLANVWSEAVAVDGFDSPDAYLAKIEKVTVEDVDRVAKRYLDLGHAVVATLTPKLAGKPAAAKGFGGKEAIALGPAKPTRLPDWAEGTLKHLAVPVSAIHPTVSTLANGITLIVQPETVGDAVSVVGHVRNRPDMETPKGKEGVSKVLDRLFADGTENLAARTSSGPSTRSAPTRRPEPISRSTCWPSISTGGSSCWPTTNCIRLSGTRPSASPSGRSPKRRPASSAARAI